MERQVFLPLSGASFIPQLSMLLLLTGCAANVALTDSADSIQGMGTLHLTWLQPHALEVQLDGKRYEGDWTSTLCTTDGCRGVYRNVLKIHRRHINKGQAVLVTKDGDRLTCEWVSHLPDVEGTCGTQDGRLFRLKAG